MNILLNRDIVQIISQYYLQVYCAFRLVSKEVKEMVDEVLPKGEVFGNPKYWRENKRRHVSYRWRAKFLENADWCGFKLLHRKDFEEWIDAMIITYGKDAKHGDRVEKFCRDYQPKCWLFYVPKFGNALKSETLAKVLELLCKCDRGDFVRELWNELGKDVVLGTVRQDGFALRYADESLRKDRDVVMAAVKQNGWAIEFADESLRKDKDVVLAAVKSCGAALQYADESLRRDKEVVIAAVKTYHYALGFADAVLQTDEQVLEEYQKQRNW